MLSLNFFQHFELNEKHFDPMLILYCEAQGKVRVGSTFVITTFHRALNLNLKSNNTNILILV